MNYIPLNIKTNYDLLCSLIKLDDLINFSLNNNVKILGINDPKMFSCVEFYYLCKKNNIKPIIGVPLKINDVEFSVYARNFKGYSNMCNLVSVDNLSKLTRDDLNKFNSDLIVVLDKNNYKYYNLFKEIFELVYLSYDNDTDRSMALSITNNVVFMNTVRMLYENDSRYLKYLYMIRDGKTIKDEVNYEINNNHFLKEIPLIDAKTTFEFESLIDFDIPHVDFKLPKINDEDSVTLLRNLTAKGLKKRLGGVVSEKYAERLKYELSVIESMGFVDYFLVVYDFILYAKKNGILVGPGRGSAVASLVSYSLGIIDIDPLKYDLIFERFLNPERISLPDIDTDFEDVRRDDVIKYVRNKYGEEKVANIISFDTLLPKAVIRDVGRVLVMDSYLIDKICKTIKDEKSFKELENNSVFVNVRNSDSDYDILLNICKKLDGLKRHTSIHAAGVVISDDNISNVCPLYRSGDNILTSYPKEYLEELGLVKMDFLALTNLTIIKEVVKLIKESTGINIDLSSIPYDDKKTLELFKEADTVGVFQFESSGMRNVLRQVKADSFDDLVAIIALFRPGPRDEIPSYTRRKHGKERITYLLPELRPILESTHGIIVYQEQVLEILRKVAGYSYAEADNVRKAMSKKNEEIILKNKDKFIKGALERGHSEKDAVELFDKIQKFSMYGFNKSHAVAYSIVAYQMQFLKANFKEYYMANLLNSIIGSDEKTKIYIDESKVLGIEFVLPNILLSKDEYYVLDRKIVMPLTMIKNVGRESVNKIISERDKEAFNDYFDFVRKVSNEGVNKRIIESLIDADVFKCFNLNKRTCHENLENALNYASLCKDLDESLVMKPEIIYHDEYEQDILMEKEYNSFGFYYSTHPVTRFRRNDNVSLKNIPAYFDKTITTVVLVENVKTIDTKKKDKMAFLTVSDEFRKVDAVLFPRAYEKYFDIKKGLVIRITAKVEKRMSEYQLVINGLEYLK